MKQPQFVVDGTGQRIGVLLDLKAYEALREAAEDRADEQTFATALPAALTDLKEGRTINVDQYIARRKRK